MAVRPQPAHIKWPFDEKTAEGIEKNFRTLFQDTKALNEDIVVPVERGGTGQTDFDAGDLLYAPADGEVDGLAIDTTAGRFLRTDGSLPEWSLLVIPNTATVGDILYASASNVMSMLADVATGNALISGGVATAPSWGKIGLTTHVSGILPIANGGTNKDTFTTGSVIYYDGTRLQEDNSGLFFNAASDRLGIGTAIPTTALHLASTGDVEILIEADTDNADETHHPRITFSQDGGAVTSRLGYAENSNNLELISIFSTSQLLFGANNTTYQTIFPSGAIQLLGTMSDPGAGIVKIDGQLQITTPLDETYGGTGTATFTQGDTLYASAANTLAKLAKDTNATRYLSNTGSSNNPAWAQVALATGVSGTLPVGNGGTGATSFTAGSVVFSNGTILTQDNANLFWDDSNNHLGIGTATPSTPLDIIDQTDYQMTFEGNAGGISQAHLVLYTATSSAAGPVFVGKRAKTSIASPSQLLTNDELLRFGVVGYHSGGAFDANRRVLTVNASEDWTSSAMGYHFAFLTRSNGTAAGPTERMRLGNEGNINIGASGTTSNGTVVLEFEDGTAPTAAGTNKAVVYAEDVSGTVNLFAMNEAGTATRLTWGALQTYTETNVTTDRAYDANATSIDELADVLGTLIGDLRARGIVA